jgi:hypothetical protein
LSTTIPAAASASYGQMPGEGYCCLRKTFAESPEHTGSKTEAGLSALNKLR